MYLLSIQNILKNSNNNKEKNNPVLKCAKDLDVSLKKIDKLWDEKMQV